MRNLVVAYKVARQHFIEAGNNRVILCTDGDFNVGQSGRGVLGDIVAEAADGGVALSILGFGMGNLKDDLLQTLSHNGKGNYAYIDSDAEARKVFLEDLTSNLFTIAKDVKIQVEMNPAHVKAYRLIGYMNRRLNAEDFNDDTKKAGDIGPGHSVVALYEIVPPEVELNLPGVDALRYQGEKPQATDTSGELATVKVRYKSPESSKSALILATISVREQKLLPDTSDDFRLSAAVAAFGMRLRGAEGMDTVSYSVIRDWVLGALSRDPGGHRSELSELIAKAARLEN
jgi:Ca-activated chloride channel family protein